ncbi:unnamed protein product [Caenorhabditis angaria]|uniref:glucuronosyltransferase n=1 Tax=Caenorhabditis angaria TaxID=860376 RepID=A0A9P1N4T4_9PELO|nr:unnamed protein product [Caenorhabditis angaria]
MSKLSNVLADGGHNVTALFLHHLPMKNMDNLIKNKNIEIINYYPANFDTLGDGERDTFHEIWESVFYNNKVLGSFVMPRAMAQKFTNLAKQMLNDKELHDLLENKKFDAHVAETFELSPFYLAHLIKIPKTISVFSASKFSIQSIFGQPNTLGYIPGEFSKFGPQSGFFDRLNDFYYLMTAKKTDFDMMEFQAYEFSKMIGDDIEVPTWQELVTKSTYYFFNSNPYLDFAMANVGSIVNIGGFTIDKSKKIDELPEEYENILKERPSTVLISFGSVVRSYQMPESYKNSFLNLFQSLPDITFIWKYEKDDEMLQKIPKNVHLKKWVPQPSLLADPRVKLFITHGGLGSTMEVAYAGKPALMIPLFGDQPNNAMMLSRHGGAQAYNKNDVPNHKKLVDSVSEIIGNSDYDKNAKQLQMILNNQPIDPKENLLKHMEFSVKFPKLKTLIPENNNNNFIAYYYIDVWLFVGFISISFLYFSYRVLVRFVVRLTKKSKTD